MLDQIPDPLLTEPDKEPDFIVEPISPLADRFADSEEMQESDGLENLVAEELVENPEFVMVDGKRVALETLVSEWKTLKSKDPKHKDMILKAVKSYRREQELHPYQAELIQMQNYLIAHNRRMVIIFEGRDAAGKGGTIRLVSRHMNERHYRVVALGKPTVEEESQWYYQKYVAQFPSGGEIVMFDRSWYTRAMVERVFGFCTEKEYKDFMRGVVGFEKDLVRQGTILVKLYFSVTQEVQAARFERRQNDPLRRWKLSQVDLQAQDRWDDFTNVKYDMLKRTNTPVSPWFVIRSDDKHLARLNTMKLILNSVPYER
ncbi:MAG: polyphosphate kinase 2, partial [Holophaga sp.]|nr:polyphosphate kinase 2 [Holophaga sp.]